VPAKPCRDIPGEKVLASIFLCPESNFAAVCGLKDINRGGRLMQLTEYFVNRALECQELAQTSTDPESRATWNQFAARWRQAADRTSEEASAALLHARGKQKAKHTSRADH